MNVELSPEEINTRIAELDTSWNGAAVRCQCSCGHECRGTATVTAEIHVLHACNGLDSNDLGNRIELLCSICAQTLWKEASRTVARLLLAAARTNIQPCCTTCQAPMTETRDLVRSFKLNSNGIR